jgi:hypothetical protein
MFYECLFTVKAAPAEGYKDLKSAFFTSMMAGMEVPVTAASQG